MTPKTLILQLKWEAKTDFDEKYLPGGLNPVKPNYIELLMLRSYEKIIASCVLTEGLSPLLMGHTGSE